MTEQQNLILAVILSIAILVGFQVLYEGPRLEQQRLEWEQQQAQLAQKQQQQGAAQPNPSAAPFAGAPSGTGDGPALPIPGTREAPGAAAEGAAIRNRAALIESQLAAGERIKIATPRLNGSLRLVGGRIDDLTLKDYHETPDPKSPEIVLLTPAGADQAYYAEFGWVGDQAGTKVPDARTRWTADAAELTQTRPVTLSWDNGEGLRFERVVAVDTDYLFTITQRVVNTGTQTAALLPYGLISRHGTPQTQGFYILHEGALGVFDGRLSEFDYAEVKEAGSFKNNTTGGWIGITDKYWLVSLIPDQTQPIEARVLYNQRNAEDRYQVDILARTPTTIAPGAAVESTSRLFAGAKQVRLVDAYASRYNIQNFDLAIDFGWFYFLTKPFFYALDWLNQIFGNFGIAIILFTVIVKGLFYPLADKSYRAMSKMKKLQPEVVKLREKYENDKVKMNEELMALYKREGANPVSGCLPILIQIPVFFALYKVLFVTIEMRHAPFFGWIQDLSAPDPTTVFNLFGMIPWQPPEMFMIGAWPLLMGLTMWVQQKLNPAPPDPIQAKMFMILPILFTYLLAQFPAGLVIYWAWNNLLSIAQQWLIMRRMGVSVT